MIEEKIFVTVLLVAIGIAVGVTAWFLIRKK